MSRTTPTKGNVEWLRKYLKEFEAKTLHQTPSNVKESVYQHARDMQRAFNSLHQLDRLGQFEDLPVKKTLDFDHTANMEHNDAWQSAAFVNLVTHFGRFGLDAVSSMEEAVAYSYALADLFGSQQVFYRGEQRYGYELRSRAERHLDDYAGSEAGLTPIELDQIARFQKYVRRSRVLAREIKNGALFLPRRRDPRWLPLMQHYDEEFGTRMLDISTSIFTGLYFASVGWDGEIDTDNDGILYLFMRGTGLTARGYYYDQRPADFDEDFDELAPKRLNSSFVDWPHPEYFRIYKSSSSSPRELAQDGWFLVRGVLNPKPQFGQGFKFRVPADAKAHIAKQL